MIDVKDPNRKRTLPSRPRVLDGRDGNLLGCYLGLRHRSGTSMLYVEIDGATGVVVDANVPVGSYEFRKLASAARRHMRESI
jgi:hypothetical protein